MIIYILHSITHWGKPCPFKLKKIVLVRCLDRFKWKSMYCIKQLFGKARLWHYNAVHWDITWEEIEPIMNQKYRQYWKALSLYMSTLYNYEFTCMHVYCVLRGVKRPDIVKEMFMFALFHWNQREPNLHIGCHKIYI